MATVGLTVATSIAFSCGRGGNDLTVDGCVEGNPGSSNEALADSAVFLWMSVNMREHEDASLVLTYWHTPASGSPVRRQVVLSLTTYMGFLNVRSPAALSAAPKGTRHIRVKQFACDAHDTSTNERFVMTFPEDPSSSSSNLPREFQYVDVDFARPALTTFEPNPSSKPTSSTPKPHAVWTTAPRPTGPIAGSFFRLKTSLVRRLPDGVLRMKFAALATEEFSGYTSSLVNTQKQHLISRLLALPRLCCRRLVGRHSTRTQNAFLRDQLALSSNTSEAKVCTQTEAVVADVAVSSRTDSAMSFDERVARRAFKLVVDGHVGRAAKMLASEERQDQATAVMLKNLKDLHPLGPAADTKSVPSVPAFTAFDVEDVRKTVKRQIGGAAPGPSGWTEELLFDTLASDGFARAFAALCTDIANNEIPHEIRVLLTDSRLIGIPKVPSGTRPIALGECFLKTAETLALDVVRPKLITFFAPLQYGCNVRGGAEHIVHHTRQFARHSKGNAQVIVTIDQANAFNTPYRDSMRAAVILACPALLGLFDLSYGSAARLFVVGTDAVINSERGARQGTVTGPVFFSLVIQSALIAASAIPGVTVKAYLDDVTFLANCVESAEKAASAYITACATIGLAAKVEKCEFFSLSKQKANPDSICAKFAPKQCIKLLGAQIAADDAAEQTALYAKEVARHDRFFKRLKLLPGPQGFTLLQKCALPKQGYIVRVQNPDVSRRLCQIFDAKIEEVWSHWAAVVPTPVNRLIAQLPVTEGGLGLPRSEVIAPAAYEASRSTALSGNRPKDLPTQRMLAETILAKLKADAIAADTTLARLLAYNSMPGAGDFLTVASEIVDPDNFSAALRLRLGSRVETWPMANPQTPAPMACPGCPTKTFEDAPSWMHHVVGCARISHQNATVRHNVVCQRVRKIARDCGWNVPNGEPRHLHVYHCECGFSGARDPYSIHAKLCMKADLKRALTSGPDISFDNGLCSFVGDVTIRSGLCQTYATQSSVAAFAELHALKHASYGHMCTESNVELVVMSAYASGAMSDEFARSLDRISKHGGVNIRTTRSRISSSIALLSGGLLLAAERAQGIAPSSRSIGVLAFATRVAPTGYEWQSSASARATPQPSIRQRIREALSPSIRESLSFVCSRGDVATVERESIAHREESVRNKIVNAEFQRVATLLTEFKAIANRALDERASCARKQKEAERAESVKAASASRAAEQARRDLRCAEHSKSIAREQELRVQQAAPAAFLGQTAPTSFGSCMPSRARSCRAPSAYREDWCNAVQNRALSPHAAPFVAVSHPPPQTFVARHEHCEAFDAPTTFRSTAREQAQSSNNARSSCAAVTRLLSVPRIEPQAQAGCVPTRSRTVLVLASASPPTRCFPSSAGRAPQTELRHTREITDPESPGCSDLPHQPPSRKTSHSQMRAQSAASAWSTASCVGTGFYQRAPSSAGRVPQTELRHTRDVADPASPECSELSPQRPFTRTSHSHARSQSAAGASSTAGFVGGSTVLRLKARVDAASSSRSPSAVAPTTPHQTRAASSTTGKSQSTMDFRRTSPTQSPAPSAPIDTTSPRRKYRTMHSTYSPLLHPNLHDWPFSDEAVHAVLEALYDDPFEFIKAIDLDEYEATPAEVNHYTREVMTLVVKAWLGYCELDVHSDLHIALENVRPYQHKKFDECYNAEAVRRLAATGIIGLTCDGPPQMCHARPFGCLHPTFTSTLKLEKYIHESSTFLNDHTQTLTDEEKRVYTTAIATEIRGLCYSF